MQEEGQVLRVLAAQALSEHSLCLPTNTARHLHSNTMRHKLRQLKIQYSSLRAGNSSDHNLPQVKLIWHEISTWYHEICETCSKRRGGGGEGEGEGRGRGRGGDL